MYNPVIIFVILEMFSIYSFRNYAIFLILVHAALLIAISLSYRFIELPFLSLKEKYSIIKTGADLKKPERLPDTEDGEPVKPKTIFNILKK